MKILTLDDASGYGGQQYYVDDAGKFAGLVPAKTQQEVVGINELEPSENVQTIQNQFSSTGGTDSTPTPLPLQMYTPPQGGFSSPDPIGLSPPTQTMDDLTSALSVAQDLNLDPAQRFKNRASDLTGVRYGGDKPAYEYDLGDAYDNVVAVRQGGSVKFFKDGERVGSDVLGIDSLSGESGNQKISSLFNQLRDQETQEVYDQFGGVEGDLVSQYLQDQAAAAKRRADADERSDERDAKRFEDLRNQVSREAEALGISTDDYYDLGFPMRASMAGADIAEVFDPSLGKLFQNPNDARPNNPRNLGVLSAENIKRFQDAFPEGISPERQDKMGSAEDLMFMGQADSLLDPPSGFTIPGTNITITAPEGDMSSGGGYGGGAGSGSGDRYGTRPKFGAFANISGGGGGGIWDRFRSSYLTKYGLEGESADMDEIKVRYDPESGVYFYPDGTPIDPADLEGLDISDTFEEQTGTERFKL